MRTLDILNASQPNGLAVPDATLHPVNSLTDVIQLMRTGLANRAVGSTALNNRSSRSHRLFSSFKIQLRFSYFTLMRVDCDFINRAVLSPFTFKVWI